MATLTQCSACGQMTDSDGMFCESCGGQLNGGRRPTLVDPGRPRQIVIGRDDSCTYQIDKPTISLQHALLEVMPGGQLRVSDLGSTNGVGVNSPLNRISSGFCEVNAWDRLYLGRTEILVSDILKRTLQPGRPVTGKVETAAIQMRGASMVFGRGPGVDFPVPHPMVSARHAQLTKEGNQFFIEDLGSTNGTFVRGRRVPPRTKVPVKVGDEIGFGSYTLVFNELGCVQRTATGKEITVTADSLCVCVPGGDTDLLGDVSMTIEPSDLVALMGPSGAGKTTFMQALNGVTKPSRGKILYRNLDLAEHFDQFQTMIGYVPQDDIMHAQLTVRKALYYTAKLRLPADYSDAQIDERIRTVLQSVGLSEEIDKVIGDAVKKTLSGGQRKRVNLAMELLSEPWALFLDEPTSGLSAVDALQVVKLLKGLADQGRTVIVTIHQPSLEVYGNFNLLAMISNHRPKKDLPKVPGRLVYFGPTRDAFEFFSAKDGKDSTEPPPEKIEEKLLQTPVDQWVKKYDSSRYKKLYVGDRKKSLSQGPSGNLPSARKERFRQLAVLCRRLAELKIRDRAQLAIALALPLVFGALVALSEKATSDTQHYREFGDFAKKIGTAHFLMVVAAMWFGCNNAIREIVGERAIYRRERLVNLSLFSYFASKYLVLGGLALVQCVLMLVIVHFGVPLQANFGQVLLTLWITAMAGTGLGLCLSSLSRSNEQAVAFLPLALLPMIVLGGSLTTVAYMSDNPPLGWLSDIAPTRWAYENDFVLENDTRGKDAQFPKAEGPDKITVMQEVADCQKKASDAANQAAARVNRTRAEAPNPPPDCEGDAKKRHSGYEDAAETWFPQKQRSTYKQSMSRLGILAGFWALATLLMLKKDEWEWWRTLASRLKFK